VRPMEQHLFKFEMCDMLILGSGLRDEGFTLPVPVRTFLPGLFFATYLGQVGTL
jgi:hypothetical protein